MPKIRDLGINVIPAAVWSDGGFKMGGECGACTNTPKNTGRRDECNAGTQNCGACTATAVCGDCTATDPCSARKKERRSWSFAPEAVAQLRAHVRQEMRREPQL